ncbi:MAG TPA: PDZ domain-containing protein, partial [Blastocatellia bacterium]|nr:PDZ domain-containing protein [Blastocatellia bacterium]
VDTRRFNPQAGAAQRASGELNNPFYVPPAGAYPAPQPSAPVYQTASLRKSFFRQKALWLILLWIVSLVAVFGVGIAARANWSRRNRINNEFQGRKVYSNDAQNALGFQPGNLRDAEYSAEIKGMFVESLVGDDSPAALAGIQAGDVLTELNEQPVRNQGELGRVLDDLKPQAEIPAKVYREGEEVALRIKIADRAYRPPQMNLPLADQGFLGVTNTARRCCIPNTQKRGVEIQGIFENGPADLGGLREGDLITEFNGTAVRTPGEFNRLIRAAKPRSKVTVTFYRGTVLQKIELTLGHRT